MNDPLLDPMPWEVPPVASDVAQVDLKDRAIIRLRAALIALGKTPKEVDSIALDCERSSDGRGGA